MSFLPGLSFAAPWALALLALLPLLWRLLRVTPPSPQRVRFPAIRLLLGLKDREEEARSLPPWLLALRLALAASVVLAAARPVVDPGQPRPEVPGALLLAVDDGWGSARDWPARRRFLERLLTEAGRQGRPVLLLPTAPPADGGPVAPLRLMPASEAIQSLAALEPKPWPTDRRVALAVLAGLPDRRIGRTVWLGDGLDGDEAFAFARALQSLGGGLELAAGQGGRQLLPPAEDSAPDRLAPVVRALPGRRPERIAVRGLDASGAVLVRQEAVLEAGATELTVPLHLPPELRNRLARLEIEGEAAAAATVLLDERFRRRAVGLAEDGPGGKGGGPPLLDRLYYLERALGPHADLRRAGLDELVAEGGPGLLILPDRPIAPGPQAERLAARVEAGAVVVRFAGPLLAQAEAGAPGQADPLLPVRLRSGGRAMGGAMSWTTPMGLAPFPEASPFHGLDIPAEVEVRSQVLAEPSLDLAGRVWAGLADGTPLITAARRGKGWVVLVHTTANAEWSNLPLSGLFVGMLRRLTALSVQGATPSKAGALPPSLALDGFGRLVAPTGLAMPLASGGEPPRPGPRQPPGYYGEGTAKVALNLGPLLAPPRPLAAPPGATRIGLEDGRAGFDLGPALLMTALALLVVDGLVTLGLKGLLRRGAAAALLVAVLPSPGWAADDFALEAGLATRLGCLRTSDQIAERGCLAGLRGLSAVLARRSTANLAEPMAVDAARDPLALFPLLYWRLTPGQQPLAPQAAERLNTFMARGGLLVLDVADGAEAGALARGLALPPLVPLAADHVLNRSFYLLKEAPGRQEGGTVWVASAEAGGWTNDGVSPVVMGSADWAGAWAVDDRGRPLHAVAPGGERQREMALRFGVNLVMYALTGNYKADQVHLPAILERLGR